MKSQLLRRLCRAYATSLVLSLVARRSPLTRRSPIALAVDFLPLAFAPLPAAFVAARAIRDRPLQLLLTALATAFPLLYGSRLLRRHSPVERGPTLRILTFNMLCESANADRVARLVFDEAPDAVALQELEPVAHMHLVRALASAYPHHVAYPAPGHKGLGWWSRFPLRELDVVRNGDGETIALAVEVCGPGGTIRMVAAHPLTPAVGLVDAGLWLYDSAQRDREIAPVLELVSRLPPPLVLAGDFNMTDQSASYANVTRTLRDAFAARGRGLGHTYPASIPHDVFTIEFPLPLLRLDYVFHTPDLLPLSARVLRRVGSDHLPVIVSFAWPQPD